VKNVERREMIVNLYVGCKDQRDVDNLHFLLNDKGYGYYDSTQYDPYTRDERETNYTLDEIEAILGDK
jgi:hypothetical protein